MAGKVKAVTNTSSLRNITELKSTTANSSLTCTTLAPLNRYYVKIWSGSGHPPLGLVLPCVRHLKGSRLDYVGSALGHFHFIQCFFPVGSRLHVCASTHPHLPYIYVNNTDMCLSFMEANGVLIVPQE